jgi:hypothetical protein
MALNLNVQGFQFYNSYADLNVDHLQATSAVVATGSAILVWAQTHYVDTVAVKSGVYTLQGMWTNVAGTLTQVVAAIVPGFGVNDFDGMHNSNQDGSCTFTVNATTIGVNVRRVLGTAQNMAFITEIKFKYITPT